MANKLYLNRDVMDVYLSGKSLNDSIREVYDKEIKDNIFKELKTTKGEKGTGFGLYYSNTMIESSFKGRMYFETQEGVGTTFYIEIPNNKEGM